MAEKYKQREMAHRVKVETLQNGYAFTVDGHEYICFTAEQLVNEVFVRLGLEMLEYVDHETLAAIVEACAKWQDINSALMANATLMAETKRAHSNENVAISFRSICRPSTENRPSESTCTERLHGPSTIQAPKCPYLTTAKNARHDTKTPAMSSAA